MSDLLQGEVWAVMPERLPSIRARLAAVPSPEAIAAVSDAPGATARVAGGVAVIPLHGAIMPRASALDEFFGVTGLDRFGAYLNTALANDQVGTILLDVDSPGGSVGMVAETWAKIMEARASGKKIVAQVSGLCASAAYWLASAADEIICTPSGEVGSIGVIMVHTDISGAAEQAGMRFTVLTAGKFKGEGHPFGPLDESATAAIQARLDEFYGMFTGSVAKGRGVSAAAVRNGFGEGRVLSASAAKAAGMVDRIASMDETMARLTARKGVSRMRSALHPLDLAAFSFTPGLAVPPDLMTTFSAPLAALPPVPVASGGEPAVAVPPLPEPAPKAKELHMPDETAGSAEIAALTAKVQRMEGFTALRKNHPTLAADLTAWEGDGVTLQQAQANTMAALQAKLTASTIRVDGVNESGALPNEAKEPFATFGAQLQAIQRVGSNRAKAHDLARLSQINAATSGMNEGTASDGGFAVAPQFLAGIMEPVYNTGEIASRVMRIPVGASNTVTFNVVEETTRASGSRWGGVQFIFAAEGGQGTASRPKLRQTTLTLKKAIGLWYATDELLEDSPAMEALAQKAFSTELTFFVEDQFINGQGSGAPLGILNAPCTVSQAIEGTQTIANSPTFIVANTAKMKSRFGGNYQNAVWLANQELEPTFIQATLGGTAAAFPVYMPPGGLSSSPYGSILGRPVIFVDYCAAVGTPGDLILADMSQYATIDKGNAVGAASVHLRFDYDETAFRMTYRFDGQPIWKQAITPYKGSLTRSPFVTLAVRS